MRHSAFLLAQITSIDIDTAKRTEQTSGPGLKLMSQLLPNGRVGLYLVVQALNWAKGFRHARLRRPRACGAARPLIVGDKTQYNARAFLHVLMLVGPCQNYSY